MNIYKKFLSIFLFLFICTNAKTQGDPLVILISIDGLSPEYIFNSEKFDLKLPNIKSFIENGTYATGVKVIVPTLTAPAHATIITGSSPAKHGIHGNSRFDPLQKLDTKNKYYIHINDIKVPTLWELTTQNGKITANIGWPVAVNAKIAYNIPDFWDNNMENIREDLEKEISPKRLKEIEKEIGPYKIGWKIGDDRQRCKTAEYFLENYKIDFMTIYFASFDDINHPHGPNSPECLYVLNEIDILIGDIIKSAHKISDNAIIALVSDHGFLPVEKDINLNVALKNSDLIKIGEDGKIISWEAYASQSHGTTAVVLKDPNNKKLYTKMDSLLKDLNKNHQCFQTIIQTKDLNEKCFTDASFIVEAKRGFSFNESKLDGKFIKKSNLKGTHGHLPNYKELEAIFLIKGSGIPHNHNLGKINLIDIAPTLAPFLGISNLQDAEGKDLLNSISL